jgi:hypothetical protein
MLSSSLARGWATRGTGRCHSAAAISYPMYYVIQLEVASNFVARSHAVTYKYNAKETFFFFFLLKRKIRVFISLLYAKKEIEHFNFSIG